MRLHILSDLHVEFARFNMPFVEADLLVLAGDIGTGLQGVEAANHWANYYEHGVIYVLGNHEWYNQHYPIHLQAIRNTAHGNVHVLENDAVIIEDTRILGCTLWTDFALFGESTEAHSRLVAAQNMNDYKLIRTVRGKLNPVDTQFEHRVSRRWLEDQLALPFPDKTVVVTHHAPSRKSMNPNFRPDDPMNPAYASNLDHLFGTGIQLWVSGHTHYSTEYTENGTRVISNCRGYPEDISRPDPNFNPELVVEV